MSEPNGQEAPATVAVPATTTARPPTRLGLIPKTIDEAYRLAKMIADSGLAPKDYVGKPNNVMVAMQMGAEVGLAPMQALQNIAVINGRPSLWGDAALAVVQASGLLEWIDEKVTAEGTVCRAQRKGYPEPIVREFTISDAKTAGLLNKDGPWKNYPKRMMQMRARSWVLRDAFADALRGLAVAEEVMDIELEPSADGAFERTGGDAGPAEATGGVRRKSEAKAPETKTVEAEVVADASARNATEPADQVHSGAPSLASAEGEKQEPPAVETKTLPTGSTIVKPAGRKPDFKLVAEILALMPQVDAKAGEKGAVKAMMRELYNVDAPTALSPDDAADFIEILKESLGS